MNCLLNKNNIVLNLSSLDKAPLVLGDDPGEDFFNSVRYNFGDDFVPRVAKQDRAESGEALGTFLFGN